MIMRWRQVLQEDRKWKDILICYSGKESNDTLLTHEEALAEAKKRLNNENTVRIIIERGEF